MATTVPFYLTASEAERLRWALFFLMAPEALRTTGLNLEQVIELLRKLAWPEQVIR